MHRCGRHLLTLSIILHRPSLMARGRMFGVLKRSKDSILSESAWAYVTKQVDLHKDLTRQANDNSLIGASLKELHKLEPLADTVRQLQDKLQEVEDTGALITETISGKSEQDKELYSMAVEDQKQKLEEVAQLEQQLLEFVLPKDSDDSRNAIVEVRAGAGGEEASIFAHDVLRMYEKFAKFQGWNFQLLEFSTTDRGGFREASALVKGHNVFGLMKHEVGTHRVQRVPVTEASGRVHTSVMSVAVMAEATEVDVDIKQSDVRVDIFRSSGNGGQSVNTTDSAVRLTHVPSGITVSMQDERSQHANREKAWRILRSRLYQIERKKHHDAWAAAKKKQVGSGERNERIRTYNYHQGRITDHRTNSTKHGIEKMLNGELLGSFLEELQAKERLTLLEEFNS